MRGFATLLPHSLEAIQFFWVTHNSGACIWSNWNDVSMDGGVGNFNLIVGSCCVYVSDFSALPAKSFWFRVWSVIAPITAIRETTVTLIPFNQMQANPKSWMCVRHGVVFSLCSYFTHSKCVVRVRFIVRMCANKKTASEITRLDFPLFYLFAWRTFRNAAAGIV